MEKFIVTGDNPLKGKVTVSGAKNVALKVLVAACLTDEEIIIRNVPGISDVSVMIEIMEELGGKVSLDNHTLRIQMKQFTSHSLSLEKAAKARTSIMFMVPLLYRSQQAIIPNPGGCRLGARPIDRIIDGLQHMGATIVYKSDDGYFHAKANGLHGTTYTFLKNTHTGTETLILAAAVAKGQTILKNAAEEPEIDDLIALLNKMGAKINRTKKREITIDGVEKLHGTDFTISPDRNEIVTLAIAGIATEGDIFVEGAKREGLEEFLEKLDEANAGYEEKSDGIRFFYKGTLKPTDTTTAIYPGFMTDWQSPWAVLMTKAKGISTIHETVFENKMGYIFELKKMGASIKIFKPEIKDPEHSYNFNLSDDKPEYIHAIKIHGPTGLHNAVVNSIDLRAGATVVIAALIAKGETTIFGIEKLERGYERFDERLRSLGAHIKRVQHDLPL